MDTLPIELLTVIATDTFELFTILLRVHTIGNRLCEEYPQRVVREKFISVDINEYGTTRTYLNDKLHSFNDQPAIVCASGDKHWYWYGQRHRKDLPACVSANGYKSWYWYGQRHRSYNLPAVVFVDGRKEWYIHGEFIK